MSNPPAGVGNRLRVVNVDSGAKVIVQAPGPGGMVAVPEIPRDYERGYADGQAAATKDFQARMAALEQANRQLASELPAALAGYLQELEGQMRQELVEMSLRLTTSLTASLVAPEALVESALHEIMPQMLDTDGVSLRLSPTTAAIIQKAAGSAAAGLRIVADPRLGNGDASLETPGQGIFNATFQARLDTLGNTVRERLASLPPPNEG